MIDKAKLRELLIERAKEAGTFSATPAFFEHLEAEVEDFAADDITDHETDLNLQIKLIRDHNVALGRIPYDDYPYKLQVTGDGRAAVVKDLKLEAKLDAKLEQLK